MCTTFTIGWRFSVHLQVPSPELSHYVEHSPPRTQPPMPTYPSSVAGSSTIKPSTNIIETDGNGQGAECIYVNIWDNMGGAEVLNGNTCRHANIIDNMGGSSISAEKHAVTLISLTAREWMD